MINILRLLRLDLCPYCRGGKDSDGNDCTHCNGTGYKP